jgi:hypothetical protein
MSQNFHESYPSGQGNLSSYSFILNMPSSFITSATMDVYYDDCGSVTMNGNPIHDNFPCSDWIATGSPPYAGIDIAPFIQPGKNWFNVWVNDSHGGGAIGYDITIHATFSPGVQCCGEGVCSGTETCVTCSADCPQRTPPTIQQIFTEIHGGSFPGNVATYLFTMDIPAGSINTALMDAYYDDCGTTEISGVLAHETDPWPCVKWAHLYPGINIKPYLVPGENTFRVHVRDVPGTYIGYKHTITVTFLPECS